MDEHSVLVALLLVVEVVEEEPVEVRICEFNRVLNLAVGDIDIELNGTVVTLYILPTLYYMMEKKHESHLQ